MAPRTNNVRIYWVAPLVQYFHEYSDDKIRTHCDIRLFKAFKNVRCRPLHVDNVLSKSIKKVKMLTDGVRKRTLNISGM